MLNIVVDSMAMELRLSDQQICELKAELQVWGSRSSCKKRKLLSLIGILKHAYRVVRLGRSFLRRLIDLSYTRKHPDDWIRLNRDARSDIRWWGTFAKTWNGRSLCLPSHAANCTMTSDAPGTWGCGTSLSEPVVPA